MIGISGSLIWSKTLIELKFYPCGEFRWSPEGPVSQIHSPQLHTAAHGIFSDLLMYVQMLKRECGTESNGKLPHLFIPSKTAILVPQFAVEALHLGRTVALVAEFAVKDLPLGRTLWWYYTQFIRLGNRIVIPIGSYVLSSVGRIRIRLKLLLLDSCGLWSIRYVHMFFVFRLIRTQKQEDTIHLKSSNAAVFQSVFPGTLRFRKELLEVPPIPDVKLFTFHLYNL